MLMRMKGYASLTLLNLTVSISTYFLCCQRVKSDRESIGRISAYS